jgi:hypothetical protein
MRRHAPFVFSGVFLIAAALAAFSLSTQAAAADFLAPGFCANDGRLGISGVLFNLSLNGRVYRPCPSS